MMRAPVFRRPIILWVAFLTMSLACISTSWADSDQRMKLPDDPSAQKAKDAYNAGKYADAVKHFREIARRHSRNVVIYRELARSLSWADEPEHAIRAYWQYLDLAPQAADSEKVKAELGLLLRRVKTTPSKTPSKKILSAFEDVKTRTKAGRFNGQEGALGALNLVLKSKHISPRIADAQDTIRTGLRQHSTTAIDRWWALDAKNERVSWLNWSPLGKCLRSPAR